MSLFEKLNNKRYNLQEEKKDPYSEFDAYDNPSKEEQKQLRSSKKQSGGSQDPMSGEQEIPIRTRHPPRAQSGRTWHSWPPG